jgi:hypothetical protein
MRAMNKKNWGPPTTLIVRNVIKTDNPPATLRPKLPVRLLSTTNSYEIGQRGSEEGVITFEIFPKPVKKSSTGNGVMEPDICKQNGFQKLCNCIKIAEHLENGLITYSYTVQLTHGSSRCLEGGE